MTDEYRKSVGREQLKYESSNYRHAECGGERGDEENDIRPETQEAVFSHGPSNVSIRAVELALVERQPRQGAMNPEVF